MPKSSNFTCPSRVMKTFSPFSFQQGDAEPTAAAAPASPAAAPPATAKDELSELKQQMAAIQEQLAALAKK